VRGRSYPPFYNENIFITYEKILSGSLHFPSHFTPAAKNLIKNLLQPDLSKRYGCMENGVEDIKNHKFFEEMDFGTLTTPWRPLPCHLTRPPAAAAAAAAKAAQSRQG
jgi:serine/threonine protein kinase